MVYLAAKLAALESLRGGFTTVVDAGTRAEGHIDAVAEAARAAGLRCVLAQICNDLAASVMPARQSRRAGRGASRALAGDALIHPSLAISIPEVATDAMLRDISGLCAEAGALFQTHVERASGRGRAVAGRSAACGRSSICIASARSGRRRCSRTPRS